MVRLALRAYWLEHGTYPANLAQLIPEYLKSLPNDPFALTGNVRYQLNGEAYLLYSVGPDGVDDGGASVEPVDSSVKGDVVGQSQ